MSAALLLFVALWLYHAPAAVLGLAAQRWAPQLQLSALQGSLWRGEAVGLLRIGEVPLPLGRLQWSLQPWSLLALRPSARVATQATDWEAQLQLQYRLDGSLRVEDLIGEFALSVLEPWAPLLLDGKVLFQFPQLVLDNGALSALEGRAAVQRLVWLGGDRPMPLGDYRAEIAHQQQQLSLQLHDEQARLAVDGQLLLGLSGSYRFNARLTARADLAPEVATSIGWFGKKNAQGQIVIDRSGRWL